MEGKASWLPSELPFSIDAPEEQTYNVDMKTIHITFDEQLLEELDNDEEVKLRGRSVVIRSAVAEYLRKRRRATIAQAYRRGYGKRPAGSDLGGWANEGVWPEKLK